ncbi:methyl-accepting chemotaxis protein [Pleionea sediminis]|uniref:methyl-accepting chemotaxis protein n=1 Tax=Pleionea sediminis TaxID=2569479 RepID=UPI0011856994|nr:methyl-accepting chemotaxis protein [Pleionea sediminis]
MKKLFRPAVLLMNRLKYSRKFLLVVTIFLLPLGILGFGYLSQVTSSIERTKQEIRALELFPSIHKLYLTNQRYIQEAIAYQNDLGEQQAEKFEKSKSTLLRELNNIAQQQNNFKTDPNFKSQIDAIKKSVESTVSITFDARSPASERYSAFSITRTEVLQLYRVLANQSGITNDPELASFYLGQWLTTYLYNDLEPIDITESIGYAGLISSPPSPTLYDDIASQFDDLTQQVTLIEKRQAYLMSVSKKLSPISNLLEQQSKSYSDLIDFIDQQFLIAVDINTTQSQLSQKFSETRRVFDDSFYKGLELLKSLYESRIHNERKSLWTLLSILIISMLLSGYLFLGMSLSIGMSIGTLIKTAKRFSSGDTTAKANFKTKDEMNSLKDTFNWMIEKIGSLLVAIDKNSSEVASQSQNVEKIAAQTGEAIDHQKKSTENIVMETQHFLQSVVEISENTDSVQKAVDASNEQSQQSEAIMRNARASSDELSSEIQKSMSVISDLESKSNDISQVLEVIKNIAEQTNLLALNAAIEAARAGDQGRGFAVVADEVRTLAKRTQDSTQQIESTVLALQEGVKKTVESMNTSSDKTEKSAQDTQKLEQALNTIKQSINEIAAKNQATQSTSEKQQQFAQNIERLLKEIQDISNSTEENSKQTIIAGQQMTELANRMKELVEEFKQ